MIFDHGNADPRYHAVHDFFGLGLHGDFRPDGYATVNIPVWPHCVVQISRGYLTRHGNYHPNRWGVHFLRYDWCCARRVQKVRGRRGRAW